MKRYAYKMKIKGRIARKELEEDADGDYVRYEDVKSIVTQLLIEAGQYPYIDPDDFIRGW